METVVFTNGCFDILHPGHIELLEKAKKLGTKLIVGINSDESVKAIKGNSRPIVTEASRAAVLRGLKAVDEVVIFNESTPQKIIEQIKPDILVKGGDWSVDQIIGANFVQKNGGKVYSIPLKDGFSTSSIVEKINLTEEKNASPNKSNGNFVEKRLIEHIETIENILQNEISIIEECGNIIKSAVNQGSKIFNKTTENIEFNNFRFGKINNLTIKNSNNIENNTNDKTGDIYIFISNGVADNEFYNEVMKARESGCQTIALTSTNGRKLASLCDKSILVASESEFRVNEAHLAILNIWSEMI